MSDNTKLSPAVRISVPFPSEPGSVFMTEEQWAKFRERVGEPCAFHLCEQAEDYAEQWPKRFAKYKDHYRTLMAWYQRKVADGYEFFDHPQHGAGFFRTWVVERATGDRR